MIRLLLVRHGVTLWNAQRRYQGHTNVPLSEWGLRQAEALADRLAGEEIHAAYASDLQRAWETAHKLAAPHGLEVKQAAPLREIHFGDWEGLSYDEIERRYPQEMAAWRSDPMRSAPPGGETLAEVSDRVRKVAAGLEADHQEETVLVVAHGGVLQVLLCTLLGLEPRGRWQFRFDNASLSEIHVYDGGSILTLFNDTHHLAGLTEGS